MVSRGGGENLDIFNKVAIAETAIALKALLISYEKEIENLKGQNKALDELKKQSTADLQKVYEEKQKLFERQIEEYRIQVTTLENRPQTNWTMVIIAVIAGLILGYLLRLLK